MEGMFPLHGFRFPTSTSPVPSAARKQSSPLVKCADDLDRIPRSTFVLGLISVAVPITTQRRASFLRRCSGQAAADGDARVTPKPTSTLAYTPPQKPWGKLAELKPRHARDTNWRDLIVDASSSFFVADARVRDPRRPRRGCPPGGATGARPWRADHALGLVAGFFAVVLIARLLRMLPVTVRPPDLFTIVPAALLIGAVAVGASLIPAWRASRADPMTALKAE
jgi:hypothetical protein